MDKTIAVTEESWTALLKCFGSISNMARAAGVSPQAAHKWRRCLPVARAVQLARLSKGAVTLDALLDGGGVQGPGQSEAA